MNLSASSYAGAVPVAKPAGPATAMPRHPDGAPVAVVSVSSEDQGLSELLDAFGAEPVFADRYSGPEMRGPVADADIAVLPVEGLADVRPVSSDDTDWLDLARESPEETAPEPDPSGFDAPDEGVDTGVANALIDGLENSASVSSEDPGLAGLPEEFGPAAFRDGFGSEPVDGHPEEPPASPQEFSPRDFPGGSGPGESAFADTLLRDLADNPSVSSGDPGSFDMAEDSVPVSGVRDPEPWDDDPRRAEPEEGLRERPAERPAAALAFAMDPDTEDALREGLLRYVSPASGFDDPQVWSGGLRAAIAALADGYSTQLVIVDIDGISYPAGAIHELAEVCEIGTVVIAIGSDDSARLGRELLLAGVSDYLVKPITAAAVREATEGVAVSGGSQTASGCVAGFAGTGGSGATTLAVATALHAAELGRYVSVLDLGRTVPAAALLLDVEPAPGLDQLFETAGRMSPDPQMLDGVRAERSERISVYAYRWGAAPPPVPSMAALDWLLGELRHRSQLVLVDGLDDPAMRVALLAEVDVRVLVAEPTLSGANRAARLLDIVGAGPSTLLVQNHTREFRRGAGERLWRGPGMEAPPDIVIPFDPSLPEIADRGWPKGRVPRRLRKPLASLAERILKPDVGQSAGAPGVSRRS